MSAAFGRHLQQLTTNPPAAVPSPPPVRWTGWDGGADLNYGSRVGEHTDMLVTNVLQNKWDTADHSLTRLFSGLQVLLQGQLLASSS